MEHSGAKELKNVKKPGFHRALQRSSKRITLAYAGS
jgi:hypothetical protein